MRTIWLLNDTTSNPLMGESQTRLVREYLRANGFITRLEDDLDMLAKRVAGGDVVFGVGWDERLLKIKGLVYSSALDRESKRTNELADDVHLGDIAFPSVKLVALLPWGPNQVEAVSTEQREFEERFLRELDVALVRSSTEKVQLLQQHQIFDGDDLLVVGGFETIFNVLNVCPKVSWEARENLVVFPYQESKSTGCYDLSFLVAEYSAKYPDDELRMVALFGSSQSRALYLAEVAKAKVMFSGRDVGWPTELIDASFLGVYPMTINRGIFEETIPESYRYQNRADWVDRLHDLIHQSDCCPMLNFASVSLIELMKAL